MKLHIGSGERYLNGYKHVDIIQRPHIDFIADACKLSFLDDRSVEEIYASHVLEHFTRDEVEGVLCEWWRVLRWGGVIRLAVPDFAAITAEYVSGKDLDILLGLLYGGQNYEYNFHYQTYDFKRLEKLLNKVGFVDVREYDWRGFLPEGYDDFSKAYLPHMDFENGRLMSLNIEAMKG